MHYFLPSYYIPNIVRLNLDLLNIHLREIYYGRLLKFTFNLKISLNNDKSKIRNNNIVLPRCKYYTFMGFEIIDFIIILWVCLENQTNNLSTCIILYINYSAVTG